MTVSKDVKPYNNWYGNGINKTFDFDFFIKTVEQLKVTLLDKINQPVYGMDYSITGVGNTDGGHIVFPLEGSTFEVLKEDEVISLTLDLPIEQKVPYPESEVFYQTKLEEGLDYVTRLIQIQDRKIERSVKIQEGLDLTPDELIESIENAKLVTQDFAQTAEQKATEAYNHAVTAGEEATIATQKVVELQDLYNDASEDITNKHTEAITAIETDKQTALNEITVAETTATENIETTKNNAINNVQALGIYMRDDRLFYKDNQGIVHEFRNDFGGIAPMGVKHRDIQKVDNGFALTWTDPDDSVYEENVYCTWGKTVIVRKLGTYPESPFDGEVVLTETVKNTYSKNPFVDEVDNTQEYKYRAFPCSINEVYSLDKKNKFGSWIYAFEENDLESIPSKRYTYLEDNEHFKPNYMNFSSGEFEYGDWKNSPFYHPDWIRPCMLYNSDAGEELAGTVMEYLDPNDYSKTVDGSPSHYADQSCNANAMVEKRKIFLKIEEIDENRTRYYFSNIKQDDTYECYPCLRADGTYNEFYYTPMFHGSLVNNKIRSLGGGLAAISGRNAQQEIDLARANGNGYDTETWGDIYYELLIFAMTFKNANSQSVLGNGVIDSSNGLSGSGASGKAYNKGANYGTNGSNFPAKFRHRENFYTYQWQRLRGIIYINGIPYVKMTRHTGDGSTASDYNITGDGYIKLNVPTATGTSGGYISKTKATQYGVFSTVVSGSSSTYLCDGRWFNNSGIMYPCRGGSSADGSVCGTFALNSGGAASDAAWNVGAALSYHPL